ncbi:MAG: hypothetical protein D6706_09430 [Chloroflexi bacterium]|nr:MAG: hypothetical protein D6706_09430 [Chloroflexota bacterium]
MTTRQLFPSLAGFEPTRKTLHLYANAVGVIPRAHGIAHPKWWHISLKIRPDGLVTDNIPLPHGGSFFLRMDLIHHVIHLTTSTGDDLTFSMTAGLTATQMGEKLIAAVADLGLRAEYAREKFENDEPRVYEPDKAVAFFTAVTNADLVFKRHQSILDGNYGPVQLWPHGFDLAFEWFGTRTETYEEHGEVKTYPSQLNLGFYPGNEHTEPYFYSNPWPFEADKLLDKPLPKGARWFTEGWQGSIFPYSELEGDENAAERLLTYARTVYEVAAPTLLA